MELLQWLILFLATLFNPSHQCTSTRGKLPSKGNEAGNVPDLFGFIANSSQLFAQAIKLCPKSKNTKSCQLIQVNFDALRAMKLKIPMREDDPKAFLIIKKVSEEGLDMALHNTSRVIPATIYYKIGSHVTSFVLKGSHLYAHISLSPEGHKLLIEPCPKREQCHILIETKLKKP